MKDTIVFVGLVSIGVAACGSADRRAGAAAPGQRPVVHLATGKWSCEQCEKTEEAAPTPLPSTIIHPGRIAWFTVVGSGDEVKTTEIDDAVGAVATPSLQGWVCTVGNTVGKLVQEETSSIYVEDRRLYCAETGATEVKLITSVECGPHNPTDTATEALVLDATPAAVRVALQCRMNFGS